jgi:hypothetical protein
MQQLKSGNLVTNTSAVIIPPVKTLPRFKGSNRWYLGVGTKDVEGKALVMAISLSYEFDKYASGGKGVGELDIRFAAICNSPSLATKVKVEGISGFNPRFRQLFQLEDKGIDGVVLDKVGLKLFKGQANKYVFLSLFQQHNVMNKVAEWITSYCTQHGIEMQCGIAELIDEMGDFFITEENSVEFDLVFPVSLDDSEPTPSDPLTTMFKNEGTSSEAVADEPKDESDTEQDDTSA